MDEQYYEQEFEADVSVAGTAPAATAADQQQQQHHQQQQQADQQAPLSHQYAAAGGDTTADYAPDQSYDQYQQTQSQSHHQSHQSQQQQQHPYSASTGTGNESFRPTIPPYLHSSLGAQPLPVPLPLGAVAPLPQDPRATADYQVAWELELWRRTELKAQQERWKIEEQARMRILEEEFAKAMRAEEAKMQVRLLKVAQSEKAAQAGMQELERARTAVRMQQNELASRVASLDKELAKHKGDADAHVGRVKDQTAYEVAKTRAQLKDALSSNELLKKELKATQAKLAETREEHEKDKLKHAKSNFGACEAQLRRRDDELASMEAKWREACAEREHEKSRLAAALGKGMALFKQIEDLKAEALEAKNRDADFLRAQYLAKERQSGASRSVAEAHDIMKEVKAHLHAMSGPARTHITDMPVHQPAALAHSQRNTSSSSYSHAPPAHSTAHVAFNTFQPAQSAPAHTPFGIVGSHPAGPASLEIRAHAVPEPYQFLMHEQEQLSKERRERGTHASQPQSQSSSRRERR